MARPNFFAMRITAEERKLINQLAQHEERTPSDVVRRLIRQAAQQHEGTPAAKQEGAFAGATTP